MYVGHWVVAIRLPITRIKGAGIVLTHIEYEWKSFFSPVEIYQFSRSCYVHSYIDFDNLLKCFLSAEFTFKIWKIEKKKNNLKIVWSEVEKTEIHVNNLKKMKNIQF